MTRLVNAEKPFSGTSSGSIYQPESNYSDSEEEYSQYEEDNLREDENEASKERTQNVLILCQDDQNMRPNVVSTEGWDRHYGWDQGSVLHMPNTPVNSANQQIISLTKSLLQVNQFSDAIRNYWHGSEDARFRNVESAPVQVPTEAFVSHSTDVPRNDPGLDVLAFADIKARFIENFLSMKLPGETLLNLSKCFQRQDEDVSFSCIRLQILGAKLLKEDLNRAQPDGIVCLKEKCTELLLNQFKIGLRKDLLKEKGILLLREEQLDLEQAENWSNYRKPQP
ncbi:hypothetical protein JTB14_021328 [Gonioctena quinquepunctata]|nr:hypothetical protein JTB14_021328 [Gonioctena quinquepunctata]